MNTKLLHGCTRERESESLGWGGVGGMSPAAVLKRNMKDYDYMLRNMLNI